mgnify:CR=1 FL=1
MSYALKTIETLNLPCGVNLIVVLNNNQIHFGMHLYVNAIPIHPTATTKFIRYVTVYDK